MTKLKEMILNSPRVVPLGVAIVFVLVAFLGFELRNPTDIYHNAAMITNRAVTHGGTGIVLHSSKKGSLVLTNDHVCRAIATGGVIKLNSVTYQVQSMLESQVSDLCLIFTPDNLYLETKVARSAPGLFDDAKAVGHPALMPTVISNGEFSEKAIIQVITGFKPCTEEDFKDPDKAMMCLFAGGVPTIKSYESQLVTTTIMPGSSGSGVYNASNELSGVVFAGSGDFGYAWAVPHDQLVQFLYNEVQNGKWVNLDQEVHVFDKKDDSQKFREMLRKCKTETNEKLVNVCAILGHDVTWVK